MNGWNSYRGGETMQGEFEFYVTKELERINIIIDLHRKSISQLDKDKAVLTNRHENLRDKVSLQGRFIIGVIGSLLTTIGGAIINLVLKQ